MSEERALRHFKTVLWPQAYRTQDTQLLGNLLHDTFEMIDQAGNRSTKKDELAYVADNPWDPGEFTYTIERLAIYDDMAIVDGRGTAPAFTYMSSNVLVKESDRWQAVSSHVSGFEEKEVS